MADKDSQKSLQKVLQQFATTVRQRRHELDLTQEELAERAGFHVNFIGSIERAKKNPSLTSIIQLAHALALSPRDLLPV